MMSGKVYDDYFSQLKGFTIVDYESGTFPTFIMKKGTSTIRVEVSQDEEGNGGGFLFIENAK